MIVTFLKGFLVVGLLSWYSIALLTVINDYFRAEFKAYIENPAPAPSTSRSQSETEKTIRHPDIRVDHIRLGDNSYLMNNVYRENQSHCWKDFMFVQQRMPEQCLHGERSPTDATNTNIDATARQCEYSNKQLPLVHRQPQQILNNEEGNIKFHS